MLCCKLIDKKKGKRQQSLTHPITELSVRWSGLERDLCRFSFFFGGANRIAVVLLVAAQRGNNAGCCSIFVVCRQNKRKKRRIKKNRLRFFLF